jgi:hypothetical protein
MKTKIKKLTQKGFSHFELALVIVIVAAISAVGFYVFNAKNNKSKADSMTSVTNKLIHGSYVSIDSCVHDNISVTGFRKSGTFIFTDVMLTDERYFDTNTNKPMIISGKQTSAGMYLDNAPGPYTGRAKPESYKVIVAAIQSGKKNSTSNRWTPVYKYTNNHGRINNTIVGPIDMPKTSSGPYSTIRYYIMFHGQLVYTKDIKLNQISKCGWSG